MKVEFTLFLKFCLASAIAFTAIAAKAQKPAELFTEAVGEENSARQVVDSDILRRRIVRVNLETLAQQTHAGGKIQINLFEDLSFEGIVEKIENRSEKDYSLAGRLNGDELSSFALSANEGGLVMNVHTKEGDFYQIRCLGNGLHEVRKRNQAEFPPCGTKAGQAVGVAEARAVADQPQADAGNIIDVMVVYTAAARIAAMPTNTMQQQTAYMSNLINLAVFESNTAYQQSLITPRIRLVYQGEVSYTESGTFTNDLNRLTLPSDGHLDQVHALRNTYSADLVSLWINDTEYCGLAHLIKPMLPSSESLGFSTVYWDCATGYYSFAHEMAHNMGCHHDRENAFGDQGVYSYSHGWRFTGNSGAQFRTVMGYAPGARINYFSNPNVSYDGVPTGVAVGQANEAHNAQTINNTAATIANFRQSVGTNTPPSIITQPQPQNATVGATITFTVYASGTPPLLYFWRKGGTNISGATTNYSYSITNVQYSDTNIYSVVVSNAFGTAVSSNAALTIIPLAEALDATGFSWNSGGTAQWAGQNTTTHDGTDAAQSGIISHSQDSWFETTFSGPGTLTYWHKVSSETNYDFLRFYVTGILQSTSSGEVAWTQKTVNIPAGSQVCRWTYSKDGTVNFGQDRAWVDQVSFVPAAGISLPIALDNAGFNWATGGSNVWAGQSAITHDGVDAAQSGIITDSQIITNGQTIITNIHYTTLHTTVAGPGTLSFWWKVSSETNFDYLDFFVDASPYDGLSGEINWTSRTYPIPAGTHTLSWQYAKDESVSVGQDKGWVDQISYIAASLFLTNSSRMTNNQFQLQFSGFAGASYTLQASTNLINWTTLTNVVSSNLSHLYLDSGATNFKNRFYRIVSP